MSRPLPRCFSANAGLLSHPWFAMIAMAAVCLLTLSAAADGPRWNEKGVAYLNFESKKEIMVNDPGGGGPVLAVVIGPRFNAVPGPPAIGAAPLDPAGRPFWLVPPVHGAGPDVDPASDMFPSESQAGPPRHPQPAFSGQVFLGVIAPVAAEMANRAALINAIRTQVQSNYSFAHIDIELAFDPVTFTPNAAAFGAIRGDFEWREDAANPGHWYVFPIKFNGVTQLPAIPLLKDQRWMVDIGGAHATLRGYAICPAPPRKFTPRGKAYVFSNNLAAPLPAAPFAMASASNGVSHTTAHELGHLLGVNATPPTLVIPFTLGYDASGHTICNAAPPPVCLSAQVNRMTAGDQVPSAAACSQACDLRSKDRKFRIEDKFDIALQVGPSNAFLRGIFQDYDTLRKAPPPPNNNDTIIALRDALQNAAVRMICDPSERHYTSSIRNNAVSLLNSWIGQSAPYSFPPESSSWLPGTSTDTIELAALMLLAEDSRDRLNNAPLADIVLDGTIGVADLLAMINGWGPCPALPSPCPSDVDCSMSTNVFDLLTLINFWGPY